MRRSISRQPTAEQPSNAASKAEPDAALVFSKLTAPGPHASAGATEAAHRAELAAQTMLLRELRERAAALGVSREELAAALAGAGRNAPAKARKPRD